MLSGTDAQQLHFAQCLWALHPGSEAHLSGRVGASCGGRRARSDVLRPTPGGRLPQL